MPYVLRTYGASSLAGLRSRRFLAPDPEFSSTQLGRHSAGRPVVSRETRYPVQTKIVAGQRTRAAAIGEAFANSLAEPGLCGGMPDVLQIWKRRARTNLDAIIKAVEGADSKIVKVRAGHIFAERLEVREPRIDAWRSCPKGRFTPTRPRCALPNGFPGELNDLSQCGGGVTSDCHLPGRPRALATA